LDRRARTPLDGRGTDFGKQLGAGGRARRAGQPASLALGQPGRAHAQAARRGAAVFGVVAAPGNAVGQAVLDPFELFGAGAGIAQQPLEGAPGQFRQAVAVDVGQLVEMSAAAQPGAGLPPAVNVEDQLAVFHGVSSLIASSAWGGCADTPMAMSESASGMGEAQWLT